jgi:argininosuccinate synthase
VVRFKLYKGNIIVAGRRSPMSLYEPQIATMEKDASVRQRTDSPWRTYNQSGATGFIRLNALRLKMRAAIKSSSQGKKILR